MEIQENREPEPVSQITEKQHYKVFVGGLAPTTTSDDLREYFSKFGLVDEVTVMRERVTGRSRCFAFMTFLDQEALEKVLELPQHWFRERTIEVKRAIPRGEVKARSRKLFVGGIPPSVTSEALRAAFEKYGKILDAQVMKDRVRDRPRGFGFITFEDDASLDQVLAESQHELGGKVVDVKKAEPKKASVPHSNNSNPYPMVPALTYFIPYHVLPGPGGESFVSFPSTYPDIYYPHPTVSQPGIPQPQILPFDQRPSYGEIQAVEDAIENFSISGTHRQPSEINIGFSPQGLPVTLPSSPNMYYGANQDAANQSSPSPTDGENNKSKKSNSNKKNENSNEEKNSGTNDNCSKNSANSNVNNNNKNNSNSNSNNNNAIIINDQNSSLINPNNKNGYNVGNVNNNSPNNNSNNPIKNRRSPIFFPYNFVPSIISGLSQPYPPPPMYLPFPYDHSTPTSHSNPATSNPH